jgi:hypothetical protein
MTELGPPFPPTGSLNASSQLNGPLGHPARAQPDDE